MLTDLNASYPSKWVGSFEDSLKQPILFPFFSKLDHFFKEILDAEFLTHFCSSINRYAPVMPSKHLNANIFKINAYFFS